MSWDTILDEIETFGNEEKDFSYNGRVANDGGKTA